GKPVYIAGDLNEDPRQGCILIFKDNGFKVLNDRDDPSHATGSGGGYVDLILEHNVKPNHQLLDRGIPLSDEERATWRDNVSDHFPYRVKVKIR
ncbi:MAG: hypothetical protein K2H70_03685, partial [Bacteroidales bacterium]|nr:hypothetical protein [Bacteroidales bacterium]